MIGDISFSLLKQYRADPSWDKKSFMSKLNSDEKALLADIFRAQ